MLALTFQVGNDRLALDIHQVRAVVPRVHLNRVPGGPGWLAGLFVYHEQIVPVVDLHRLLGAGDCPPHLSSRIILVPWSPPGGSSPRLFGLLAAQVADIREIQPGRQQQPLPSFTAPGEPDLGQPLVEDGSITHLIDLRRFLPESVQCALSALPPPAPAADS
jgi:chemotaxis-related protein WspB